eukprot:CAMPEP_0168234002 /NCGR_PEP_ID=MMETSP0140_2-20121125/18023_1 /TAXON_ID=44445 /ORGANISM="Pseudo-nitzschia australis, Strain 10249 10 AB" /LENGTH=87 /DNA_ID=CAMNT_0008166745 /DNA_START=415 /DNA_END=678 /DNA_ORIENTATION=-
MTNSIPVVAGVAVAQSLLEGAASLVLPQSFRVLPPQGATTNATRDTPSQSMAGTKASDYESPSSCRRRRRRGNPGMEIDRYVETEID